MSNIFVAGINLFVAFLCQGLIWRVYTPKRQILALIVLYLCAFIALLAIELWLNLLSSTALADLLRLASLYISITLVYAVIYSAVEAESPTLMIINHIVRTGSNGCSQESLEKEFLGKNWMMERLRLMKVSGLLRIGNGKCALTEQGHVYARLFDASAKLFGITRGG